MVSEMSNTGASEVVDHFFRDRFGGLEDYLRAVRRVWGEAVSFLLTRAAAEAEADVETSLGLGRVRRVNPREARFYALLLNMPEPDFRLAVEVAVHDRKEIVAERVTCICRGRGVPWVFTGQGFEYVGDEQVERDLIRPALSAINRPEFAGGVRAEFESARRELARGTPDALKQAVHEAGCSVESAMKVLLDARGVPYGAGDTAQPLFNHLEEADVIPRYMEKLVLVAMTPRNRKGGHGAGAQAHEVDPAEAEAIVAGAGGAIAYLATLLP